MHEEVMMKLNRIPTPSKNPVEKHYIVDDISPSDIAPPTERFFQFVREVPGFAFINFFTKDEFTAQVRKRFATGKPQAD